MEQFDRSVNIPESCGSDDGIISVSWNDPPAPIIDITPDIVYQELSGEKQHIQLFRPARIPPFSDTMPERLPVIVHVPGSAWHRQFIWMSLRRAISAASAGFAVAVTEYRPSDIAPFPAQVEDAKSAIRFLRANADKYQLDPDRIAIWGDSSGGHTAAFVGITGDDCLNDGPYGEYSSAVKCAVDWFGPTDVYDMSMAADDPALHGPDSPIGFLIGRRDVWQYPEEAKKADPIRYLSSEKDTPPFLIMHGSEDPVVPFRQSELLYSRMKELGKDVRFIRLIGGGHGTGGFESTEATETVLNFIREKLHF